VTLSYCNIFDGCGGICQAYIGFDSDSTQYDPTHHTSTELSTTPVLYQRNHPNQTQSTVKATR